MTSLAFIMGMVPLVFASGAGAAARRSMGTGVFGGMLVATFVATIFIPLFFTWLSGKHVRHHGHVEGVDGYHEAHPEQYSVAQANKEQVVHQVENKDAPNV